MKSEAATARLLPQIESSAEHACTRRTDDDARRTEQRHRSHDDSLARPEPISTHDERLLAHEPKPGGDGALGRGRPDDERSEKHDDGLHHTRDGTPVAWIP
jgi:hypothetical protein